MDRNVYLLLFLLVLYLLIGNSMLNDCNPGYWGVPCQKCEVEGCICNNGNNCLDCVNGYYKGQYVCNNCSSDHCLTCSNANTCNTCKPGFTGNKCEYAITCSTHNCICTRQNTCDGCKDGYSSPVFNCLIQCSPNCSTCSDGTTCTTCKKGSYGTSCEMICSHGCYSGLCNKINGTCSCATNFAGAKCDQCVSGRYGTSCEMVCSHGCDGISCNQINGTCRCAANFTGTTCDQCALGRYGALCELICPLGCYSGLCNKIDGTCSCAANLAGTKCDQCVPGRYGLSCDMLCSQGCDGGSCDKMDGTCNCAAHFAGTKCDQCVHGRYGSSCEMLCSVGCNTSVCNKIDGVCTCLANFTQANCDHCVLGMYGDQCNKSCSQGCVDSVCNRTDGHCTCIAHFAGDTCDKCLKGRYGTFCGKQCSVGCSFGECNKMDATCKCLANFTGQTCDQCVDGKYGEKCSSQCPTNCANSVCNQTDGSCLSCKDGYYGPRCEMNCMEKCARCNNDDSCLEVKTVVTTAGPNKENIAGGSLPVAAIGGGAGGGVALIVVAVVIVIYCRKRQDRQKESTANALDTVDDETNNVPVYATVQRNSVSNASNGHSATAAINLSIVNGITTSTHDLQTLPTDKRDVGLKPDTGIPTNEDNLEIDEDEAKARLRAIRFEEHGGVYYNCASEIQKGKIRVSDLQRFVADKDTNYFEEEFEKLPYGLFKKHEQSQRLLNMPMNRYKRIYPYDNSRVKVLGGRTDYINASFIDGYKRRNAFIATLGPMSKQLGDFAAFWRMIWQQKVGSIVMVTNLVEEGKDKCEQYWPNVSSSTLYGDIRVSCTTEDKYAEFIRRTFVINLKKEQKALYHLHFTAWPDKGIPEDVTSIIDFRQKVLSVPVVLGGPTVVHCSAGIGRTGTYIALDILTKEGEAEHMVDIPGCVINMRQNRPNMVQTVEQYEYLHHALVHALTFDCKPVTSDDFQQYMDGITKDMMTKKLKQLQATLFQRSAEEKEAVGRNQKEKDKNRNNADIPGDDNRPRLHLNLKPGASDYINAVYINSFKSTKHWILTQTPLPGTVNDFLTLAFQENCSCIVSMESDIDANETVGVYLPADNQVMKKGMFAVSCTDPVENEYMIKQSMTIELRAAPGQSSKAKTIQHLQYTDWDMGSNAPISPEHFLLFIKDLETQARHHGGCPILIHCLDGAGKGGLLCVIAILMEMMEVEHEVSVVNAIRKVKARRRAAIQNQEQFVFCHDCILEYISSFDTYSNFANESNL